MILQKLLFLCFTILLASGQSFNVAPQLKLNDQFQPNNLLLNQNNLQQPNQNPFIQAQLQIPLQQVQSNLIQPQQYQQIAQQQMPSNNILLQQQQVLSPQPLDQLQQLLSLVQHQQGRLIPNMITQSGIQDTQNILSQGNINIQSLLQQLQQQQQQPVFNHQQMINSQNKFLSHQPQPLIEQITHHQNQLIQLIQQYLSQNQQMQVNGNQQQQIPFSFLINPAQQANQQQTSFLPIQQNQNQLLNFQNMPSQQFVGRY